MAAKRKSEDYSNMPICKDAFNNGFCPNSKKCKFLHIERTEATKYDICKFDTCNLSITDNSKYCDIHTCTFCDNYKDYKVEICENCYYEKIEPKIRKYLHLRTCEEIRLDSRQYVHAANNNDLEYMKYLHLIKVNWDICTSFCAASTGALDCLKYAHENGCPWDVRTMVYAVLNSNYDCIKYAHEEGCPWNSEIYIDINDIKCLKYLIDNKCPMNKNTYEYIKRKCIQPRRIILLNYINESIASGKLQLQDD